MDIQWFPGHMARAKKQVKENLKLVDAVIELLDARLPASSRNPMIGEIIGAKPRVVVLNKADLANSELTALWIRKLSSPELPVVAVDSLHGRGINEVPKSINLVLKQKMEAMAARGRRPRMPRCMILGIPNVGKSFLINRLAGQRAAKTANKPGVTRGQQWIKVGGIELLDTPGILWPKFDDPGVAFKLAVTGAIKEQVYNIEEVACGLVELLVRNYPGVLAERYQINENEHTEPTLILQAAGQRRGLVSSGNTVDLYKSSVMILKEFREGLLGRFTLDAP